ncbi:hypothetical protein FRC07_013518 [Ceratobasidium sp. 392]|nr:hypothetical protein FRC07_013518 [Ceratobasidium sp. 392]
MHALGEIPQIKNYHNWEIYTDGSSCVYIDHGSRAASDAFESLEGFRERVEKLRGRMNIKSKLRFESAYWTFMQSHPKHRDLPEGAIDDAAEAVVWCHADRALFKSSNAPFSQEDAREMTELMKTISDLKRPVLKTWYCAAILRAICEDRLHSHYGQNDAREVRRREKAEDVESNLPFSSLWDKLIWHVVALVSLGAPLRYLKRIHNVDRTHTGDGVNTLRWRGFLKLLCKEWTDSNLLATVLVSATVALLAIPDLNNMARATGIIAALYAFSSVLCGMHHISNHQDRVESFSNTGVQYFEQAKYQGAGTTRLLAVILSLPLAFMLWGMFWFILAVMSYAFGPGPKDTPYWYLLATRYTSFVFFGALVITGFLVLWFFHGIWSIPVLDKSDQQAQTRPTATAVDMVTGQGGNPLMQLSGDQRFHPSTLGTTSSASGSSVRPYPSPIQTGPFYRRPATQPSFDFPTPTTPTLSSVYSPVYGSPPLSTSAAATSHQPQPGGPLTPSVPIPSIKVTVPQKEIRYLGLKVADGEAWVSSFRADKAKYDQIVADVRQECEKYGQVHGLWVLRPQLYDGYKNNQEVENNTIVVGYEAKQVSTATIALKHKGLLGHRIQGISQVSQPPSKRKRQVGASQGAASLGAPSGSNIV